MTPQGRIVREHLLRSSPPAIDAAIVALSESVRRNRELADLLAAKAPLRNYEAQSADDLEHLMQAQAAIATAAAQKSEAQRVADGLAAAAREARSTADALTEQRGVRLADDETRTDAKRLAEETEQSAAVAQHLANLADATVVAARNEALRLQAHVTDINERTRALAGRLAGNVVAGR